MLVLSHNSANEFWHLPSTRTLNVAQRRQQGSSWRLIMLDDTPVDTAPSRNTAAQLIAEWPQLSLPLHTVYEPGKRKHSNSKFVFHLQSENLGDGDLVQIREEVLVAGPELTFVQMAAQLGFVESVKLGYEYCGSYYVDLDGNLQNRELMATPRDLELRAARSKTPGARNARVAAKYVLPGADSPREADLTMLLTLPHYRGGYNLPKPQLNCDVELSSSGRATLGFPTVAPDLCWPERKIAVEYNGQWHFDDQRSERDALRRKALEETGYTVIEVSNSLIDSASSMDSLAQRIAKELHVTSRMQIDDFPQRQEALRSALGLHM